MRKFWKPGLDTSWESQTPRSCRGGADVKHRVEVLRVLQMGNGIQGLETFYPKSEKWQGHLSSNWTLGKKEKHTRNQTPRLALLMNINSHYLPSAVVPSHNVTVKSSSVLKKLISIWWKKNQNCPVKVVLKFRQLGFTIKIWATPKINRNSKLHEATNHHEGKSQMQHLGKTKYQEPKIRGQYKRDT